MNREFASRVLHVVSGPQDWAVALVKDGIASVVGDVLWVNHQSDEFAHRNQISLLMGTESDVVVYNTYGGLDPDTLGILGGLIRGGGALILLTPELATWPVYSDPLAERFSASATGNDGRFITRLIRQMEQDVYTVNFHTPDMPSSLFNEINIPQQKTSDVALNVQQQELLFAIEHLAQAHKKRPLLVYAGRGRGKSTTLGVAAAKLVKERKINVVVTAPHPENGRILLEHARRVLEVGNQEITHLSCDDHWIRFLTPAQIIEDDRHIDFLMVDEAAGIPLHILDQLLRKSHRCVFATTTHGYEGSGRGFELVFEKRLGRDFPGWKKYELLTPVRWAADDKLESFLDQALLLKQQPVGELDITGNERIQFSEVKQDQLLEDERLLVSVFSLLLAAHYRTRPYDLRFLLDAHGMRLFIGVTKGQLVCACIVTEEGELASELESDIYLGKRRPRGHLLPQTLSYHCGFKESVHYRFWRVMRIAVSEHTRNIGIGQLMLGHIQQVAVQNGVDYFGTSFSGYSRIMGFWKKQKMVPVRLGITQEQSTGEHAVVLLKALKTEHESHVERLNLHFVRQFLFSLSRDFKALQPELVLALLSACFATSFSSTQARATITADITSFSDGNRTYDSVELSLWEAAVLMFTSERKIGLLNDHQWRLLIGKVLQGRDWSDTGKQAGIDGRKQIVRELKEVFQLICSA